MGSVAQEKLPKQDLPQVRCKDKSEK